MPVQNGFYRQLSEDEIIASLENELQTEFGEDIDLTSSSVFSTLAESLAAVLKENQEQSLEDVYQAAFLDTASGADLDRVVSVIGINRRSAKHATGVQRFKATAPVQRDHPIQSGTFVQTEGLPTIEFETTEPVTLELIDSFEDGNISELSGDTSNASVIDDSNVAPHDAHYLQLDATSGAHVYNTNITLQQGTTLHAFVRPQTGTNPAVTFGVDPLSSDNHYQIELDEANDEVTLDVVESGSVTSTIDTLTSAGLTAGEFHEVEWDWNITDNIGVTVYDTDENKLGELGGDDSTYTRGSPGFKSNDASDTKAFDFYTTSEVSANIREVEGGAQGNVGSNSITSLSDPPSGVDSTTNLYPTGNTNYHDTDQQDFVIGKDRESDEELRDRANEAVTGGGDATHDAIVAELVNDTPGVKSVTVYQNKTDVDNRPGGLPPYSFEAVVFGGDPEDVAESIFEKKAVTARDYGGAHGTAKTVTVTAESNGQTRDIDFTRPNKTDVDMTLDLAVDDSYVGDDDIRDDIIRYVGGILTNGSEAVGLGVSEDVRIDAIRDRVVGRENGVVGFDLSVDSDPISTTPSVTTVDGLKVIDIGADAVAQVDGTDGSITINTRDVS